MVALQVASPFRHRQVIYLNDPVEVLLHTTGSWDSPTSKDESEVTKSVRCILVCDSRSGIHCLYIIDMKVGFVLVWTLTLSIASISQSDVAGSHHHVRDSYEHDNMKHHPRHRKHTEIERVPESH